MSYQGWQNYETWAVKLWIDNEESSYNYWRERTREINEGAEPTDYSNKLEVATQTLADALKDEHEENTPTVTGIYADLLNSALSDVGWLEIAGSMLGDLEDEE